MPVAEIIAIGTELLLGEIQDTNTRFLARAFRDAGIDLYRTMVVGDNAERIAGAIREAMQRAQIILTTGGLGPTVDDPTREAVALAMRVPTEYRPELWDQIVARFQRYARQATENNRRQAYIPAGAIPVENPVGTAPAFIYETSQHAIISLPGVPREMEHLFQYSILPYLKKRYELRGVIKARVLHISGMGESQVDALVEDLEINPNPTVGLLAHAGQVDVRITAKANSPEEADQLIAVTEATVRERLKEAVYGVDDETLEQAIAANLAMSHYKLAVLECDLEGNLASRLKELVQIERVSIRPGNCTMEGLREEARQFANSNSNEILLCAALQRGVERQVLSLLLIKAGQEEESIRSYGGPPAMGTHWAVNTALDFLRRNIISHNPISK